MRAGCSGSVGSQDHRHRPTTRPFLRVEHRARIRAISALAISHQIALAESCFLGRIREVCVGHNFQPSAVSRQVSPPSTRDANLTRCHCIAGRDWPKFRPDPSEHRGACMPSVNRLSRRISLSSRSLGPWPATPQRNVRRGREPAETRGGPRSRGCLYPPATERKRAHRPTDSYMVLAAIRLESTLSAFLELGARVQHVRSFEI